MSKLIDLNARSRSSADGLPGPSADLSTRGTLPLPGARTRRLPGPMDSLSEPEYPPGKTAGWPHEGTSHADLRPAASGKWQVRGLGGQKGTICVRHPGREFA